MIEKQLKSNEWFPQIWSQLSNSFPEICYLFLTILVEFIHFFHCFLLILFDFLGDNSNASTPGSADGADGCNDDDPASKKKSNKRVIFTKAASNIFRVWLFKNLTVGQFLLNVHI